MTTNLVIRSLVPEGGSNLSIEGENKTTAKILIPPFQTVEVPVYAVQFDQAWLELLADYVDRSLALVLLNGYELASDAIRELKHTDVNEVVGQYLESVERAAPAANLGHGIYYSGLDGHPHYLSGTGVDFDMSGSLGGAILHFDSRQDAPSDETLRLFRALAGGKITAACVDWIIAPTDPEVLTVDIVIVPIAGGPARSVLTAPFTLEHDTAIPYTLPVDPGAASNYVTGDVAAVVRSGYAPGGAPTLNGTCVDVEAVPA